MASPPRPWVIFSPWLVPASKDIVFQLYCRAGGKFGCFMQKQGRPVKIWIYIWENQNNFMFSQRVRPRFAAILNLESPVENLYNRSFLIRLFFIGRTLGPLTTVFNKAAKPAISSKEITLSILKICFLWETKCKPNEQDGLPGDQAVQGLKPALPLCLFHPADAGPPFTIFVFWKRLQYLGVFCTIF